MTVELTPRALGLCNGARLCAHSCGVGPSGQVPSTVLTTHEAPVVPPTTYNYTHTRSFETGLEGLGNKYRTKESSPHPAKSISKLGPGSSSTKLRCIRYGLRPFPHMRAASPARTRASGITLMDRSPSVTSADLVLPRPRNPTSHAAPHTARLILGEGASRRGGGGAQAAMKSAPSPPFPKEHADR